MSASAGAGADSNSLFSLSTKNAPAESGPTLIATFRELERAADTSVVQLDVESEGGPSSMMFLARGFCGLLEARGQAVAVVEQISEKPLQYRARFRSDPLEPNGRTNDKIVFTKPSCAALLARASR